MEWSIVIPAHNEAANLEGYVTHFIEGLPEDISQVLKEIILVENGSTDATYEACVGLQQKYPSVIQVRRLPRGSYGEAIKTGMLGCCGTHVAILECDFLDPKFVAASMKSFRAGRAQFVVGSKRHQQSADRRPLKRRVLTLLYNYVFLHLLIGYPGTDTHGLKSIEVPVAKRLCELAVTTDEVFQTELVLLAWRLGISIEEVPVQILERRSPTVSITRRLPKVINTVQALRNSLKRFSKPLSRGASEARDSHT